MLMYYLATSAAAVLVPIYILVVLVLAKKIKSRGKKRTDKYHEKPRFSTSTSIIIQ
jgi:hypothetical protein